MHVIYPTLQLFALLFFIHSSSDVMQPKPYNLHSMHSSHFSTMVIAGFYRQLLNLVTLDHRSSSIDRLATGNRLAFKSRVPLS